MYSPKFLKVIFCYCSYVWVAQIGEMSNSVSSVCTSDAEGSGDCGSGVFIAEEVDGVGDKWLGDTQQSM